MWYFVVFLDFFFNIIKLTESKFTISHTKFILIFSLLKTARALQMQPKLIYLCLLGCVICVYWVVLTGTAWCPLSTSFFWHNICLYLTTMQARLQELLFFFFFNGIQVLLSLSRELLNHVILITDASAIWFKTHVILFFFFFLMEYKHYYLYQENIWIMWYLLPIPVQFDLKPMWSC